VKFPASRLLGLLAILLVQDPGRLAPARHPTCLRFYTYEGDVKPEVLRKELDALGAKDEKVRVAAGPSKVSSRPKTRFLVLEIPAKVAPKEVETALKKVCSHADELAWTAFQGPDRSLPAILGYPALDCVVGMDNDLRWFDLAGGRARFFFLPGKLDAKSLRSRFAKLYQPFNAGELGDLVKDTIEWKLADPVDPAAAKSAEKAIARIPGVRKARIDAAARTLVAEIEQDGLRGASRSGSRAPSEAAAPDSALSSAEFLVDDVIDALESAKLVLEKH
jgi:hypothetical protein